MYPFFLFFSFKFTIVLPSFPILFYFRLVIGKFCIFYFVKG